jgi:WD40 repeat protein
MAILKVRRLRGLGLSILLPTILTTPLDSARAECTVCTGIAFSPDGRWVAAAYRDAGVRVQMAETGGEVATLKPPDSCWSVAFSPDGRSLGVGLGNGDIVLWKTADWTARMRLHAHTGPVRTLAFGVDDRTLVSGGWQGGPEAAAKRDRNFETISRAAQVGGFDALLPGEIRIWDPATGREKASLKGHKDLVSQIAFSPDGKLLASASWDGTLRFWHTTLWQAAGTVGPIDRSFSNIAFLPDGKRVVAASFGKTWTALGWELRLWEVEGDSAGKKAKPIPVPIVNELEALSLAPDGRTLAVADLGNAVMVWDLLAHRETRRCLPNRCVRCLAFTPDGKRLAIADEENLSVQELTKLPESKARSVAGPSRP